MRWALVRRLFRESVRQGLHVLEELLELLFQRHDAGILARDFVVELAQQAFLKGGLHFQRLHARFVWVLSHDPL